jgi:D-alanyl-D-alanine carboxypeptidase
MMWSLARRSPSDRTSPSSLIPRSSRTPRLVRVLLGAAVTAAALQPVAAAQASTPAAPATEAGLQRMVEAIVDAGAPGATMNVRDRRSTRAFTSGLADLEDGRELRADDRFRAGSITKTFVAVRTLQLVEEGTLDLDAPVATYRPRLLPHGDEITIRQLLNHTSGLFNYTADDDFLERYVNGERFRPRELVEYSTRHPLDFPPGERHQYSNTGYVVLGLVLRAVAGEPVRAQLHEHVIAAAGLLETTFPVRRGDLPGNHARGYVRLPGGELFDVTELLHPSAVWTAGALVSTAADLSKFNRALLGGDLLEPDSLAEMQETVPAGPGVGYGLGLLELELPCGPVYGHDGIFAGFGSFLIGTADGARQAAVGFNVDIGLGEPPFDAYVAAVDAAAVALCGAGSGAPAGLAQTLADREAAATGVVRLG